jgi:hypothetical protein
MKTKRVKSIIGIVLSLSLLIVVAGCNGSDNGNDAGKTNGGGDSSINGGDNDSENGNNGGGSNQTNLTGSAEEVLEQVLSGITDAGIETPMPLPPTAVTADMSQFQIGLSEEGLNRLVESASFSVAAIGTFAHTIVIIQANDSASATEVKNLVSGDGGFDAHKWICVWPEKALAVESGSYVLLVASTNDIADAALNAFEAAAGGIGSVNVFWEFADGDGMTGDFGGGGLLIGD